MRRNLAIVARRESDEELVEAARADERWAKKALFDRYAPMANGMALRLVGAGPDRDDLVQDSFEQLFGSLHRLRNPEKLGTWLGAIVVRQAGKVHRRRRLLSRLGIREHGSEELERAVSASAPPEVQLELRELIGALHAMPAALRIAMILRRVEGRQLQEIAELTGSSLATVKRRLARAHEILERTRRREAPQ